MNKLKGKKGFTLIEILVVIGIIAVLAAIVIIAINPARQFAQSRDTQRVSNIDTILNAIGQKIADSKGIFSSGVCAGITIPSATTSIDFQAGGTGINLSCLVPTYVSALPIDPSGTTSPSTGYEIYADANSRIHVIAEAQEPSIPRTTVPLYVIR